MAAEDRISITLRGGYSYDQLETLIEELQPVLTLATPAVIDLDLKHVEFVGPSCLALLVASLRRLRDQSLTCDGSAIKPPENPNVRQYLERMDFMKLVVRNPPPEQFTRNEPLGFRPCQHFISSEQQWATAATLLAALTEACECDDAARTALHICLDEVCENVLHHAYTDLGGFGTAQGWKALGDFEIGIVDLGVGIRASLTRNPAYAGVASDTEAIHTALMPRVSSTPERNAGIGLAVTRLLLAANGGSFTVRSGGGVVRDVAGTTESEATSAYLPGTVIALRANSGRPLDIGAVYAKLEEIAPDPYQDPVAEADI
jgi:anti-sigma regulatory factor (Ser/Thr protein kinase)/ABC-type transporter Mla MlaB component